ncbi:MAG: hypothetical protein KDD66_04840 [Bdellovibrionales bacterium]|nr:hypothetical protein [Bdellovibrionales bacterium]
MFTQDEIAFYGFFNNGKHLLDEFRSLLTQPMLSMRGLSQFELIVLESDITVTFRRSVQSALHELPWCHFWGDCDAREPSTGFDERSGQQVEQLTFTTRPFQLVKHFFTCCERPSPAAAVLVCLPENLANRLNEVLHELAYEKRMMMADLFLFELERALLDSAVEVFRPSAFQGTSLGPRVLM